VRWCGRAKSRLGGSRARSDQCLGRARPAKARFRIGQVTEWLGEPEKDLPDIRRRAGLARLYGQQGSGWLTALSQIMRDGTVTASVLMRQGEIYRDELADRIRDALLRAVLSEGRDGCTQPRQMLYARAAVESWRRVRGDGREAGGRCRCASSRACREPASARPTTARAMQAILAIDPDDELRCPRSRDRPRATTPCRRRLSPISEVAGNPGSAAHDLDGPARTPR
jgi:hypothetical protein